MSRMLAQVVLVHGWSHAQSRLPCFFACVCDCTCVYVDHLEAGVVDSILPQWGGMGNRGWHVDNVCCRVDKWRRQ